MNTMDAIQITRPTGVDLSQPCPIAVDNNFKLKCAAKWSNTGARANLTGAKIWLTIKAALADLDAAAKVAVNTADNAALFTLTSVALGEFEVNVPSATMVAALTINTLYYVDIQIKTSAGDIHTFLYDTLWAYQQVTKAVS